jgi:hypothetical protein
MWVPALQPMSRSGRVALTKGGELEFQYRFNEFRHS